MRQSFVTTSLRAFTLLAALALGACGGGGGSPAGGGSGGGAVGVTGTGTVDDPWTMPTENEAGLTKTMDDYLADGGYWQFVFDSTAVNYGGAASTFSPTAVYNTVDDAWTITVNGVDSILPWAVAGYNNISTCGSADCIWMSIYDAGASVAQYGTFGYLSVSNSTTTDTDLAFFYTGLKTPVGNLPGTASYTGYFEGWATTVGTTVDNSASMTADFGAGTFIFSSAGDIDDGIGGTWGSYTLDSSVVTISGNSYSGTMTGSLTPTDGVTDSTYTGTIEGAFYGPAAEQTAGAVVVENSTGVMRIQGGYWAAIP